jgi:hypothetical protein
MEAAFRAFGAVENKADGRSIVFSVDMAGKIIKHKGFDTRQIAGKFDTLFASAVPMTSELEQEKPGHKLHPNIAAYHNYVSKFERDGKTYYVRFTVQQMKAKQGEGQNIAHSSFVSDVAIYETGAPSSSLGSGLFARSSQENSAPVDKKLAQWLEKGKAEVSQVTDPETGEPRVVYHGTHGDFNTFRINPDIGAAFVSTSRQEAEAFTGASGSNVMPLFANIRSLPDTIYNSADEVSAIRRARKNGKDGIRVQDRGGLTPDGNGAVNYAVFSPNQIKSATGNTGAFSRDNDDIRYSVTTSNGSVTTSNGNTAQTNSPWSVTGPRNKWEAAFDQVIYQLQDKYVDLKKVIKAIEDAGGTVRDEFNAHNAESAMHGRIAEFTGQFHDNEILPITKALESNGISMDDFEEYLHARHAAERNAEMVKRNPTQAEIDARIKQLDADIAVLQGTKANTSKLEAERNALKNATPWTGTMEDRAKLSGMSNKDAAKILSDVAHGGKAKVFDALAKQIDRITATTRAEMQAYGLETAETVAALDQAYKHYVPLMRDMEESDLLNGGGDGSGRGVGNVRGSRIKSATGSTRDVENIFANIVAQRDAVIARGEKNRVGQSLLGLVTDNPSQHPVTRLTRLGLPDHCAWVLIDRDISFAYRYRENICQ